MSGSPISLSAWHSLAKLCALGCIFTSQKRSKASEEPQSDTPTLLRTDTKPEDQAPRGAFHALQSSRSINIIQSPPWLGMAQTERPSEVFLGGGFSSTSRDQFGCSNARNESAIIARTEGRILSLLSEHLMDRSLIQVFIEEYVAEINRLTSGATEAQASVTGPS